MGFAYCCGKSFQCFCSCLAKIPYGTGFGVVIASIGMFMFIGGSVTVMKTVKNEENIDLSISFGYTIIGVLVGTSMFLALFVLIFACHSNMDAENNVFNGVIPKFCGKFWSSFLMVMEYFLYLSWVVLAIFMVFPVGHDMVLKKLCRDNETQAIKAFVNASGLISMKSKDEKDVKNFCNTMEKLTSPSIVALVGTLLAALGTVHVLMCLSANFAYVSSLERIRKEETKEPEYKKPKSTGLFNSVQIDE